MNHSTVIYYPKDTPKHILADNKSEPVYGATKPWEKHLQKTDFLFAPTVGFYYCGSCRKEHINRSRAAICCVPVEEANPPGMY